MVGLSSLAIIYIAEGDQTGQASCNSQLREVITNTGFSVIIPQVSYLASLYITDGFRDVYGCPIIQYIADANSPV